MAGMLRERALGETLWESVLPPELRASELGKVDKLFDDEPGAVSRPPHRQDLASDDPDQDLPALDVPQAVWWEERAPQGGGGAAAVARRVARSDKLDARVLAELARRDLVPEVWVPSLEDRELKGRLGRRMHLVRLRTSAINRAHGVLSQFRVRLGFQRLRLPEAGELLERRGVPEVWRRSVAEAVAVVDHLDARLGPLERELSPLARGDRRVGLLVTIPGVGELLGLTIAVAVGDIGRFASARKLVGYSGLTPRIKQSGERSRTGSHSKAGSKLLRWAAIEAAQQAWRPTSPWNALYHDVKARSGGEGNPAKAAVARKVLIAAWHVLALEQPFKPARPRVATDPVPASSGCVLAD